VEYYSAITIPLKIAKADEIAKLETASTLLEILSLKHKYLAGYVSIILLIIL
jgi:hypothetical protein